MSKFIKILLSVILLILIFIFGLNTYIVKTGEKKITAAPEVSDCILVFGCGVHPDGTPSQMLYDRVQKGVELYFAGAAPKLLMSGDHGKINYDEVNTMKKLAMDCGVPEEDIFMDHAGFSTYESIYRARDIFCVKKVILVSQKYHLYRALYLSSRLVLDAQAVSADTRKYAGDKIREAREILARTKDVIYSVFLPSPTYLGESIPISGDGKLTNG